MSPLSPLPRRPARGRRSSLAVMALAALGLATALPASLMAQTPSAWPERAVRFVVPFAPGGTSDVLGRILASHLSSRLGQQIVVDNRAGANGNIGSDLVAKSPADGYHLLMTFDGTMTINPHTFARLPFDTRKDFAPVVNAGEAALVLVVHSGVKARTVAEFVDLSRSQPGGLFYASAGNGSTGHLAGEMFAARAGIKMTHVAYKGGAPALQDLLAGQIQMLVTALPTVEALLAEGKLFAIAVTPSKRISAMPDVPALGEAYPGYGVSSWYGIVAPAGTPEPILNRLNAVANEVIASPEVRERFIKLGVEPLGGSREDFANRIRDDGVMWAEVVRQAGVKIE